MRGPLILRWRFLGAAACAFLACRGARAQTAVWTGAGGDPAFTNARNWMGRLVPPNDGTDLLELSVSAFHAVTLDTAADVSGIVVDGTGFPQYAFNAGGGSLTLGAAGIGPQGGANAPVLVFNAPVILGADQTWTTSGGGGTGFAESSVGISGAHTLTIGAGQVYILGTNTYANLVVSSAGTFLAGSSSAAGIGTLTLQDGAVVEAPGIVSLANAVTLGANVALGVSQPGGSLTLSGAIHAVNPATTTVIAASSSVTLSGVLSGFPGVDYTFQGQGAEPVPDGGSQVVFSGAVAGVAAVTAADAALILAPVTADPLASLAGLPASGLRVTGSGYLGLSGTFTAAGAVATFFTTFGPSLAATMDGTLGFDTLGTPASPLTFGDPVDLSGFSRAGGFLGLGSATAAVLAGPITPTADHFYLFGGGGGTLTLTGDLDDRGGATALAMTHAPAPLTLVMQGANTYTGGVLSQGGVLILDSTVLPVGGIALQGGYVGDTEVAGLSSSAFLARFDTSGEGVVGFDQHAPDPAMPRQVGDAVDLSGFAAASSMFLGTSTFAELTAGALITPANDQYQFTGVKSGRLTVDTVLTDGTAPRGVTIGLLNPIESGASTSAVALTGDNTYSGGTTFNSGALFVLNPHALGTGALTVPDTPGTLASPYLASYGGSPVTIANPISVGSRGAAQGLTLGNVAPTGNDMLIVSGVISDDTQFPLLGVVAIGGPVTLAGMNTYSGGTLLAGSGNAVALVAGPMALGSGPVTVQDAAVLAPTGADVTLANPLTLAGGSTLTLGRSLDPFVLTLDGAITGSGTLDIEGPVALDGANAFSGATLIDAASVFVGSGGSFGNGPVVLTASTLAFGAPNPSVLDLASTDTASAVNLVPGQTLTLDADAVGGGFHGTIRGDASNGLVKGGSGVEFLGGAASYGGGTSVAAGTLIAGSAGALGSGPVAVASGAELATGPGVTLTLPVTLAGNATLGGTGTFAPAAAFTFSGGNAVSPGFPIAGNYVGSLTLANNVVFGTGGVYQFSVANASGVAGTDYATLDIGGLLTVTATAATPFVISLDSVVPGAGPGLANFSPRLTYSWTLLTANAGIVGFSPTLFSIDTGGFQNALAGGSLILGQSGNTLTLDFTPIPEPSTWALILAGLPAAAAYLRRGRRAKAGVPGLGT